MRVEAPVVELGQSLEAGVAQAHNFHCAAVLKWNKVLKGLPRSKFNRGGNVRDVALSFYRNLVDELEHKRVIKFVLSPSL